MSAYVATRNVYVSCTLLRKELFGPYTCCKPSPHSPFPWALCVGEKLW